MKHLAIIDDDLEILKLLDQYLTKNLTSQLNMPVRWAMIGGSQELIFDQIGIQQAGVNY